MDIDSNAGLTEANDLGGRLPLLRPDELRDERRSLYDEMLATKIEWARKSGFQGDLPDGRLIGPFNVFLQTPEMARAFNAWIDTEAEHSSLSAKVRQVIILTVGGIWQSAYEVYAHSAVGRGAGLMGSTMRSIAAGSEPDELEPDERAAYRFTRALVRDRGVSDKPYAETVDAMGVQGVADMVQLIGLYLATSALLNAFDVPAPAE